MGQDCAGNGDYSQWEILKSKLSCGNCAGDRSEISQTLSTPQRPTRSDRLTPLMAQLERKESDYIYRVENLELDDGAVYNGEAIKEICDSFSKETSWMIPHGRGELFYANGDKYTGQFFKGKPHGLGTRRSCSSQETHTGSFKEGKADGYGTLYRQNGYLFEGPFRDGVPDGQDCRERLANGSTFVGIFSQGKKNGFGILKFFDGSVYEGDFKNNQLEGNGKVTLKDQKTKYTGEFKNNQMHGMGTYDWGDGMRVYIGPYIKDKKQGQDGIYRFADGRILFGEWHDGQFHGRGYQLIHQEGCFQVQKGLWKNGKMVESLDQNTIDLEKRAIVSMVVSKLEKFEGRKTLGELDTASTLKQRCSSDGNADFKSISRFPDLSLL